MRAVYKRLLTYCYVLELASRTPPSGYCQFIPPRDAGGCHFVRHGPPALPPHLLQSVLNADLPDHVSGSFLHFLSQYFWLNSCYCYKLSGLFSLPSILARWAVCFAVIDFFIFLKMISWRLIISGFVGLIFTIFLLSGRYLIIDNRSDLIFMMPQGMLPCKPNLGPRLTTAHWHSERDWNWIIATFILKLLHANDITTFCTNLIKCGPVTL